MPELLSTDDSSVRPAISPDGTVYLGHGNHFYSIRTNGFTNWIYTNNSFGSLDRASPAIASDGTIYVNSNDRGFYAFNTNGTIKWQVSGPETNGFGEVTPPAIGSDGTVYVGIGGVSGGTTSYFVAFNPDGSIKWNYEHPSASGFACGPVIAPNGLLLIRTLNSGANGKLSAFDKDGALKWSSGLPGDCGLCRLDSTPAVATDGTIYVGGEDGMLYAFNDDGTTNWTYQGAGPLHSSPAVVADGTIYIAGYAGAPVLYAIYGDAPLACSAWPKYGKNLRQSGAAAAPVTLYSPSMISSNFQFSVASTNGNVCICASTNLVDWDRIGSVAITNGTSNFVDTNAASYEHRFYFGRYE